MSVKIFSALELVEGATGATKLEEQIEAITGLEGITEPSGIGDSILRALTGEITGSGAFLAGLCAMVLISSVFEALGSLSESNKRLFSFACTLCIALYCFDGVIGLVPLVCQRIDGICTLMLSLLPVSAALWVAGATSSCAVGHGTAVILGAEAFGAVTNGFLTRLFGRLWAFCVCGALHSGMAGLIKVFKKLCITLLVFMLSLFVFILGTQTTLAKSADGIVARSVKFAFSGFVPLVGSLLGESARNVAAAVSHVKNTVGFGASSAMIIWSVGPVCAIVAKKFCLWAGAFMARLASMDGVAAFLEGVNELLSILMALMLSVCIYFILTASVFCTTGVNLFV